MRVPPLGAVELRPVERNEWLDLVTGFHDANHRGEFARELALAMGAVALFIFVKDSEIDAFIPAPGFPQTLPGGSAWRDFFGRCNSPGKFSVSLPLAPQGAEDAAHAVVDREGTVIVLIGSTPDNPLLGVLGRVSPLLGALFRQELTAIQAQGKERLARENAAKSEQLTRALDSTRMALQEALKEAEELAASRAAKAAELRDSEAALRHAMTMLERSNRDLDQFASIAAHDLQEPLRTISSFADLLEKRYSAELDDAGREFIEFIRGGAGRARELIRDLLELARIGNSKRPPCPVSMDDTFRLACANLAATIEESKAEIQHDPLPVVFGDPSQLVQLIQNLFSNALKFRSEAVPKIYVHVDKVPEGWHFVVRDNGMGIAPQFHERIFTIFQRLHTRDEYSGSGIGLAICKKIVERHGGLIRVESAMGEGSAFHFTLQGPVGANTQATRSVYPSPKSTVLTMHAGDAKTFD